MNSSPSRLECRRRCRQCLTLMLIAAPAWADTEPDILNPGPQLPTNTGTLPQGRAYLEFAPFNYEGATGDDAGQYYTQFLAHVGATDSLELRVFGSVWTWREGREDRTSLNNKGQPRSGETGMFFMPPRRTRAGRFAGGWRGNAVRRQTARHPESPSSHLRAS